MPELNTLTLDRAVVSTILDPYVIQRGTPQDPQLSVEIQKLRNRWKKRRWQRRLLGWLPHGRSLPPMLRGARNQEYVFESYSTTWETQGWPNPEEPIQPKQTSLVEWGHEIIKVRRGGLSRVHLYYMADVIGALQPRSILEVGCGNGLNLFVLASKFPDIPMHGVELTEKGVATAKSVQQSQPFPEALVKFCPWEVGNLEAWRKIEFRQGDARALPFPDSSFDLVFTRLALEQMETLRDEAVSEISRVSKKHVMFLEPFFEFNQDDLRRNYVGAKDYFSLPHAELKKFGIQVLMTYKDFPQKLTLGAGLVLGKV
ncbi:MAG: class I SAM-dependent methyltransferase [Nitrospirales bacterium]|nr:class I SAM-dependent methyltransferase [Nitrospira sp.]MCB9710682.1 class I SAM-dependent methyltransferase [Nitrospiraceae bacterium]MDR4487705.1 class I SAM-dependent methyltransferase [Nitrospirales bacterium]